MSEIDRQRISAVKAMEALGYTFNGIEWNARRGGTAAPALLHEADAMHALLVLRADKIEGSTENFEEKTEIRDALRGHRGLRGQALARRQSARRQGLKLGSPCSGPL